MDRQYSRVHQKSNIFTPIARRLKVYTGARALVIPLQSIISDQTRDGFEAPIVRD